LIWFATGQILEDDCSIASYQPAPHELVELHASHSQRGFSVPVQFLRSLFHFRLPQVTPRHLQPAATAATAANANPNNSITTTAASIAPHSHLLTSLARHDLNAYWEGWVRCLRVVWCHDTVSSGIASGMLVRRDIHKPPTIFPYSAPGSPRSPVAWEAGWFPLQWPSGAAQVCL